MMHLRSKAVTAALRRAPCFAALSEVQLSMLSAGGEERRVPRYSLLYREGSEARSFYVLMHGRLEHSTATGQRHEVAAPTAMGKEYVCFGYEGLSGGLRGGDRLRRLTTVTAVEQVTVLHFSTHGMLLDEGGAAALAAKVFSRIVSDVLRAAPLFQEAAQSAEKLEKLSQLFKLEEKSAANETIFSAGAPADKFYVLLQGSVALYAADGDTETPLAVLPEEGETDGSPPLFGENAVLSSEAHTRSARTTTAVKLLSLGRPNFPRLLALLPDLKGGLRRHAMLRRSSMDIKKPAEHDEVTDAPDVAAVEADALQTTRPPTPPLGTAAAFAEVIPTEV